MPNTMLGEYGEVTTFPAKVTRVTFKHSCRPLILFLPPSQVVDLGCSECSLLKKLKFHREIDLLVGVDIDGAKVKKKM